ncbi:MAG: YdiL family protein [Candidatus Accumulibacter sp.]|jgi:hypothetical protein|nr:YdiL family protein [Accumulibacter sp.]
MTPITLQALRRLLFFTAQDAERLIAPTVNPEFSGETWRQWENGAQPVPKSVAARMLELKEWRSEALAATADNIRALIKEKGGMPESVFVIWYDSLDDWLSHPDRDPALWRPQQAVCAALTGLFNSVRLVRFDLTAYTTWRGEREDTDSLRGEWASTVPV